MKRSIAAARTACLLGLVLLAASGSARAQSAWAYSDVYYDAATDRVYGTTTTLVDYSTEYYYSPKVFVSLSGSDGSYSYWYCPYGGAGACANGNYAFGDVSVAPTPGVTYTVQGSHSVDIYYYYYQVNPGCTWGCSDWYDALGYSTGPCSPSCQADPYCYCVEGWGSPTGGYNWSAPFIAILAYISNQYLGDTNKQLASPVPTLQVVNSGSPVTLGQTVYLTQVRIPSDADQRSELMPIAIPISCRSPFQSDGDHRSNPRPISFGRG